MGVYACLLTSLFLIIFQTLWISSALSNNNASSTSFEYGLSHLSNSNHSINSLPLQHHHQVLVSPRGGGGEKNRTAAGWIVLRAKGGRSGGVGGSNINHRPGKAKNAASNLFKSKITTLLPSLLLTSYFYLF